MDYIYRPEKVGFMRPKLFQFKEENQVFYLSPTKILLHKVGQGRDFPYADRFNTE
jgi:hypothetical protein